MLKLVKADFSVDGKTWGSLLSGQEREFASKSRGFKALEESNRALKEKLDEQERLIAKLKKEEVGEPYRGPGFYANAIVPICRWHSGIDEESFDYYPTSEQAQWEYKATQVRRRLQRICALSGPGNSEEGGHVFSSVISRHIPPYNHILFKRAEDRDFAVKLLGEDLKYLDWHASPEAKVCF